MAKVTIEAGAYERDALERLALWVKGEGGGYTDNDWVILQSIANSIALKVERWEVTTDDTGLTFGPWIVTDGNRRFLYVDRRAALAVVSALNEMCP